MTAGASKAQLFFFLMLPYQFPHQFSGVIILPMYAPTHGVAPILQVLSATLPKSPPQQDLSVLFFQVLALSKSQGCPPKHRETVPSCQEFSSCGSTCAVGPWKELDLTLLNMAVFLMAWTSSGASGGSRYLSLVSSQFCLYKTWRENRWTGARPVTQVGGFGEQVEQ